MSKLKNISLAIAGVALCGALVASTPAQGRRNGQYRNRPGYQYDQRNWDIQRLVNNAERTSNAFRDAVEDRDRRTERRGNNSRERFFDDLTPHVQRMDEAFERLRRQANNRSRWNGRDEMAQVLRHAVSVDRYFSGSRFGSDAGWRYENRRGQNRRDDGYNYQRSANLDARWRDLRGDINALARAYGLPEVNGRRYW